MTELIGTGTRAYPYSFSVGLEQDTSDVDALYLLSRAKLDAQRNGRAAYFQIRRKSQVVVFGVDVHDRSFIPQLDIDRLCNLPTGVPLVFGSNAVKFEIVKV
ncbi:hypothetical protein A3K34_01175 [candidate division WWE3 bacterium RIFOXYC1_FULL_40_10]|uniref:Uncharacterized protein n=1 Tax=candidate division WWE3 bacterium RIFOXYA2_FULL_46_9 TaxID=1802636 RepID=A0A1F4W1X2_UNCKA|nr:MAG: hypothetical protein A3K58_01175 [candidate division WWE3 bacterium RIFOXYB1_FULL_40_22]OGC61481.1 MAG: hypothetical protein A3K37_01175 [candidate division WWE3 bacterium RIFOXYA1_FULL_40_11]OGC63414.1 MAG: hypothetical protein A2264_01655 [candidate division WWE3 bacterium RIFOXYA2_FULL_46_9]OGC64556.1 MAG: hypothetical protein A2326_03590 [candidate division WWE3 bacterium RIFOXYB2_FULL_41_6]OGC65864.1 MAG: hypothetical protein A3K34_01175 [candidate division WWE3 bacterium RIFOXYC1_